MVVVGVIQPPICSSEGSQETCLLAGTLQDSCVCCGIFKRINAAPIPAPSPDLFIARAWPLFYFCHLCGAQGGGARGRGERSC